MNFRRYIICDEFNNTIQKQNQKQKQTAASEKMTVPIGPLITIINYHPPQITRTLSKQIYSQQNDIIEI